MTWYFFGLLGCAVAQEVLLPPVSLWGVRPDLFLLLVFFLSLRASPEGGTIEGFSIGLCQDALSGGPLGLRAFSFALVGFLSARLGHAMYTGKPLAQFWLLLGWSAATGVLSLILLSFFFAPPPLLRTLLWVVTPEALFTATVGLLLLRLPQLRGGLVRPV